MKYIDKFQFKFVLVESHYVRWEAGNDNRIFDYAIQKNSKNNDYEAICDKDRNAKLLRLKCEWRK